MGDLNNLTLLNCLRKKGVAVVRLPAWSNTVYHGEMSPTAEYLAG